jgi:hypothetical protein
MHRRPVQEPGLRAYQNGTNPCRQAKLFSLNLILHGIACRSSLGLIGKPAMCPVKQQQQGKVHPVRPALGHDEYMIRRRQCPAIGDVRSVDFQFAKFLSFVKMLLKGVFRVNAVLQK